MNLTGKAHKGYADAQNPKFRVLCGLSCYMMSATDTPLSSDSMSPRQWPWPIWVGINVRNN